MSDSPPAKKLKMSEENYNELSVPSKSHNDSSQDMFEADTDSIQDMFEDETDSVQDMFAVSADSESNQSNVLSWTGISLSEVSQETGKVPEQCPPPHPGHSHTVTVQLPLGGGVPRPHPHRLRDTWDENHVRMPWSKDNLYPVWEEGRKVLKNRWHLVLLAFDSKIISNIQQLEDAILTYNSRYKDDWNFSALRRLFDDEFSEEETEQFFRDTFPGMVKLLISSPEILTSPLPLLRSDKTHSITMSQQQAAVLLVNAFFCTFPRRNSKKRHSEFYNYPEINFNNLFSLSSKRPEANLEKLKCFLSYFSQIVSTIPEGILTYQRLYLPGGQLPDWDKSCHNLTRLHIDSQGTIETEGKEMLQVDFANKYVGGGVLRSGLVQEEIRFTICPELIVSLLFTEVLGDREVLLVTGVRRFTNYSGYGDSFRFEGRHKDTTEIDSSGRLKTNIVAMDAIRFGSDKGAQFRLDKIERELDKAFVAFSNPYPAEVSKLQAVATGNWGCGAFGGDVRLKLVIQLLAASVAGRDVAYFTFGDRSLVKDAGDLCDVMKGAEVGSVFNIMKQFCRSNKLKNGSELFNWIMKNFEGDKVDSVSLLAQAYEADTDDSADGIKVSEIKDNEKIDITKPDTFEEEFGEHKVKDGFFEALDKMEKGQVDTKSIINSELKDNESKIDSNKSDPNETKTVLNPKSDRKTEDSSTSRKQSKITNFFPQK